MFTVKKLTPREKVPLKRLVVIFSFIFLFNSDYIAPEDRIFAELEGGVVTYSRQYAGIYLEGPE
jgi:hypothetical protein